MEYVAFYLDDSQSLLSVGDGGVGRGEGYKTCMKLKLQIKPEKLRHIMK